MILEKKERKILYVATSDVHLKAFHFPYLRWLKSHGWTVHVAVAKRGDVRLDFCDSVFYLSFMRHPLHFKNFLAFIRLKKLIQEGNYDIVHCHTPVVAALTRLAVVMIGKNAPKVLYTVHGYHFFAGASWYAWCFYYPIEKLLSFATDGIITINQEDYEMTKRNFHARQVFRINGIGLDPDKFKAIPDDAGARIRAELGIGGATPVLLYIAEFNREKEHAFLIRAVQKLRCEISEFKLLLVGKGKLLEKSKKLAQKAGVAHLIDFLGWRDDVGRLISIADIGISVSGREGLPIGVLEQMFFSVPVVASNIRGHRDLIDHAIDGFLFEVGNESDFVTCVKNLCKDSALRKRVGMQAHLKSEKYLIRDALSSTAEIYKKLLTE